MKPLCLLAILLLTACLTTGQEKQIHDMFSVDVTSNPDTVKDCRRIGNVSLVAYTGRDPLAPGLKQTPLEYMRLYAHQMGANTLFTVNNQSGDAYTCPAAPAP